MAQSSCAEVTVTPEVDIGASAHGRDFEGSFGLQHFSLHAGKGLYQDFSPPLPKNFCMSSRGAQQNSRIREGWRVTPCISGSHPQVPQAAW